MLKNAPEKIFKSNSGFLTYFLWFLHNTVRTESSSVLFAPKAHLHSSATDGLGVPWFSCVRPREDFRIFGKIWIFPDGNGVAHSRFRRYHWPCSCPLDSLRCVSSHWSRQETLDLPKLDFAGVTKLQNRFWDILGDFGWFLTIFADFWWFWRFLVAQWLL